MTVKELATYLQSIPADLQDKQIRVQGCDQCWLDPRGEYELVESIADGEADNETDIVLLLT